MKDDIKLLNNLTKDYNALKRSFQSKYWGKAEDLITKKYTNMALVISDQCQQFQKVLRTF